MLYYLSYIKSGEIYKIKKMKKNTNDIYQILYEKFGQAGCELNFNNNYELIVAVILSARCTDKRVNIISKDLFKKYPTVESLANANIEELEKAIYSCGFYKNKAKNLIGMAKDVVERFNGNVPSEFEDLISLSGVGRKTANVVLAVGFSKQAIAVDTHVFRVSNRLGIVDAKTPYDCEMGLQQEVDKDKWATFHHYLVLFGRYVCKSQNPSCKNCELKEHCKYVNTINK